MPKKYHTDNWCNARQMNIEHPDTFELDEPLQIEEFRKGDSIKIANDRERFWTRFIKTRRNQIIAEVDNCLLWGDKYNVGDLVIYNRDNIYDFYRTPDKVQEIYGAKTKEEIENIRIAFRNAITSPSAEEIEH